MINKIKNNKVLRRMKSLKIIKNERSLMLAIVVVAFLLIGFAKATLNAPSGLSTTGASINVSEFANLTDAVNSIADQKIDLVIDNVTTITADTTIRETTNLLISSRGQINQGSFKLTINGGLSANEKQVFTGAGEINGLKESRPEWFGATPNGAAFNKALKSLIPGGTLSLLPKTYVTNDEKILSQIDGIRIKGAGIKTVIKSSQAVVMEISSSSFVSANNLNTSLKSLEVGAFIIDGITKGTNTGLVLNGVRSSDFHNLMFNNIKTGIEWRGVSMTTFRDFEYEFEGAAHADYIIYADPTTQFYRNADNIIRGWKTSAVKAHVYLNGFVDGTVNGHAADGKTNIIDGLTIEGNVFFGGDNILFINAANFLTIRGNKQFQPNFENTKLINCNHVVISENTISWQSAFGNPSTPGHGISINNSSTLAGGDPHNTNLQYFNNSAYVISNNLIEAVPGDGIFVNNAYNVNIEGNTITRPNYLASNYNERFKYNGIKIENSVGGAVKNNVVTGSYTTIPGARVTRDHRYDIMFYNSTGFDVTHDQSSEVVDSGNGNRILLSDELAKSNYNKNSLSPNLLNIDPENLSSWANSGTTISDDSMASPRGIDNADKINIPSKNKYITANSTSALEANTVYTASVYTYSASDKALDIALFDGGSTYALKTIRTSPRWLRHSITFKTGSNPGSSGYLIVGSYSNNAQDEITGDYFIWGAKLEKGSVATDYMNNLGYGTATPTSGWYAVGDRIINSNPQKGQPKSWVCTVAGQPGTWESEGAL